MNDKFDELAKGLAQSVTRRVALRKFGAGLAGIALASLGLANTAYAAARGKGAGSCDHCNAATNYGCKTQECFIRCDAKCTNGGGY
jgi:hypothetical protein